MPKLDKKIKLLQELKNFASTARVTGKGSLSLMLVITEKVANNPKFPLSPEDFLTKRGGQVSGASGAAIKKILTRHGIARVLSTEGGRTSRGSIDYMKAYVIFLNRLERENLIDFDEIENFWVMRVKDFFAAKPFKLKFDRSKSLKSMITDLLKDMCERQKQMQGTMIMGTVLQHLVGAKLSIAVPNEKVSHHGASVADAPTDRTGDFLVGNTAIHVTTTPGEQLIHKCKENLHNNIRPLIITTHEGAGGAEAFAANAGITDRIDVLEIDQFLVANMYEWSGFCENEQSTSIKTLFQTYNDIISKCETDPSLKIEIGI